MALRKYNPAVRREYIKYTVNRYGIEGPEFESLQPGDIVKIYKNGKNRICKVSPNITYYSYDYNKKWPNKHVYYLVPYEVHRDCVVSTEYRWTTQEFPLEFHYYRGIRECQLIIT